MKWKELKELKKIEQKPVWGDEDERMLGYALDMVEWYIGRNETKCRSVSDWLKSLKERYTWKPSEHELEVLRLVAEKDGTCLMGLYKQLKKLMEG